MIIYPTKSGCLHLFTFPDGKIGHTLNEWIHNSINDFRCTKIIGKNEGDYACGNPAIKFLHETWNHSPSKNEVEFKTQAYCQVHYNDWKSYYHKNPHKGEPPLVQLKELSLDEYNEYLAEHEEEVAVWSVIEE